MIAMSRLSLKYFLVPLLGCNLVLAQQKANDFTKRLGFLEGKQSRLSGRFFSIVRFFLSRRIFLKTALMSLDLSNCFENSTAS